MVKCIQFLFVLFLIPGFPLLQCDQVIDFPWLVSENSLAAKSEYGYLPAGKRLWFDSEPIPYPFNRTGFILQLLKNPFSVLYSSFEGVLPFWRPPPV